MEVACVLREDHDFAATSTLKTIPDASPELMQRAGRYADRLSINIELPTAEPHRPGARENSAAIDRSMARMAVHIGESRAARKGASRAGHRVDAAIAPRAGPAPPLFAPAGKARR